MEHPPYLLNPVLLAAIEPTFLPAGAFRSRRFSFLRTACLRMSCRFACLLFLLFVLALFRALRAYECVKIKIIIEKSRSWKKLNQNFLIFLHFMKTVVNLQSRFDGDWNSTEIWCNGSTTDSGSVSEGSNPSISTNLPHQGLWWRGSSAG